MNNPTSFNVHVNNSMSQKRSKYKLPGFFKKYKCLQDYVYPRSTGIQSESGGPNIRQTGPTRKCANRTNRTFVCSVQWSDEFCGHCASWIQIRNARLSSVAPRQRGEIKAQHNKMRGISQVKHNKPAYVKILKGIGVNIYFLLFFPFIIHIWGHYGLS